MKQVIDVQIKFGTDGWRSLVAEDFTFANVRAVTQAIAQYLIAHPAKGRARKVLVGYDTRPLGDKFAVAVAEVFAGNGFQVLLTETPMPTPAVSFSIREFKLQGGIVVTASHNPFTYNGIKFKPYYAGPSEPEMTSWIEQRLFTKPVRRIPLEQALASGKIKKIDLAQIYLKFLRGYADWNRIRNRQFTVAYESMHGAGQDLLQRVVAGTKIKVIAVEHPKYVPSSHRPEPVGEHLKALSRTVREKKCDVGMATDGDADRLGLVGPDGQFVSAQETMALLLWHLLEDRRWKGRVVSTVSSTNMLDAMTAHYGAEFIRTPVGFKHIARLIREGGVLFGGEESGGFGFKGCVPERDGLLAGLLILEMIAYRKQSLSVILKAMRRRFGHWYFHRADIELEKTLPSAVLQNWAKSGGARKLSDGKLNPCVNVVTADGVKVIFKDKSWLLFRPSGTEPLLRVYGEARSSAQLKRLLSIGQKAGLAMVK